MGVLIARRTWLGAYAASLAFHAGIVALLWSMHAPVGGAHPGEREDRGVEVLLARGEPVVDATALEPSEAREEQLPREALAREPVEPAATAVAEPVAGTRAAWPDAPLMPANQTEARARAEAFIRGAADLAQRLAAVIRSRGERMATGQGDTGTGATPGSGPSEQTSPILVPAGPTHGPRLSSGNQQPAYASALRRARVEGTAWIHAVVEHDGSVSSAVLVRSAGAAALDESALAAVRSWRFEPALESGVPVRSEVDLPIVFRIRPRGD